MEMMDHGCSHQSEATTKMMITIQSGEVCVHVMNELKHPPTKGWKGYNVMATDLQFNHIEGDDELIWGRFLAPLFGPIILPNRRYHLRFQNGTGFITVTY